MRAKPSASGADGSRQRRALSSIEPPDRKSGADAALASTLFAAFAAAAADDADTLTHGFHSYPARLHPSIAAVVLDALAPASSGKHVVDPFCGGGTVLIEARRRGCASTGSDVNPVALRVARVKCDVRSESTRARFATTLDGVVVRSKERVRARAKSTAPLSKDEVARFEGHVLRELAGLYEEIEAVPLDDDRRALEVVLSAIIVKVSKQRADTDERVAEGRRIGRFIPTEIFAKKGHELVERWAALAAACPPSSPMPALFLEDARSLVGVLRDDVKRRADVIVTSPPYAGTYDYARHHALRAPWLGVGRELETMTKEIGARRSLNGPDARKRWDGEVVAVLRALAESVVADGTIVLVVGDGEIAGSRLPADAHVGALAPDAGLDVVATASAPRRDWRGGAERHEHLIALRRRR